MKFYPIPGNPLYEVSRCGSVKRVAIDSIRRGDSAWRRFGEVILSPQTMKTGYIAVMMPKNGNKTMMYVHRLVATTFIKNPENKEQVNHKDGNKRNNCVKNLEWVTRQENMNHAVGLGLHPTGERIGSSKLTATEVIKIRSLAANGLLTNSEIGEMFGVARLTVSDAVRRITWKHI